MLPNTRNWLKSRFKTDYKLDNNKILYAIGIFRRLLTSITINLYFLIDKYIIQIQNKRSQVKDNEEKKLVANEVF